MSDGTVAQEISYDVWGNVLSDTNPNFQPFYYVGGLYDVDTKLIKFGVRSYDPEQAKLQAVALRLPLQLLFFVGRWMQKEPLRFAGSLNFYAYCEGDAVNFVDLTGLEAYVVIWAWEASFQTIGSLTGHISVQFEDMMYSYSSEGMEVINAEKYISKQRRSAELVKLKITKEQANSLFMELLMLELTDPGYQLLEHSCVDSVRLPIINVFGEMANSLKSDILHPSNLIPEIVKAGLNDGYVMKHTVRKSNFKTPIFYPLIKFWVEKVSY